MSDSDPGPALSDDVIYSAYDRFVCGQCAGITARFTGVTIGGFPLTPVTEADVVAWWPEFGALTCECGLLSREPIVKPARVARSVTREPDPAEGDPTPATPALSDDTIYDAYDRFVCGQCAGMTARFTGVTIGGYVLRPITQAEVVAWCVDFPDLRCECGLVARKPATKES